MIFMDVDNSNENKISTATMIITVMKIMMIVMMIIIMIDNDKWWCYNW